VSLRRQLTFTLAIVLAVGLAVANIIIYSSFRSSLYGRLDDQIDGGQLQAYRYLTSHFNHAIPVTDRGLDGHVDPDLYVFVLSHAGQVTLPVRSGPPNSPDPQPLVPAWLRPDPAPAKHHFGAYHGAFRSEPNIATVGSVGNSGIQYEESAVDVPQGVLVVAESLNSTNDTLASLLRVQIVTSILVLMALCAIVLVTLRRGLRPLEAMAATTDAIAAGDLTRRVHLGRASSEVRRLGAALNSMLARIEESFVEKSNSERRLRQFVADASHELRTPLTSIRGYTELLRKGAFTDDAGQRRALERVEREAGRMGLMVDDLLLLARLDQGRPLEQVEVDLTRVGAEVVADARTVEPDRPVTLLAPAPVIVRGDRDRLGQVAHNLVRNALEHTPPDTAVTVRVRADDAMGYFTVSDEGPGLSPESTGRVFDRFWRDDASRTGGGSGLGLSIVRAIAEVLGGSATVRSAPGEGAIFEVAIPLFSPGRRRPAAPVEEAEAVRT
jgi:two-component system OmpR family sensor kinase